MNDCGHEEWENLEINSQRLKECMKCGLTMEREIFYADNPTSKYKYQDIQEEFTCFSENNHNTIVKSPDCLKRKKLEKRIVIIMNSARINPTPADIDRISDLYIDFKRHFPNIRYWTRLIAAFTYQILWEKILVGRQHTRTVPRFGKQEIDFIQIIIKKYCSITNSDSIYEEMKKLNFFDNKLDIDCCILKISSDGKMDDTTIKYALELSDILNKIESLPVNFNEDTARAILDYVGSFRRENNIEKTTANSNLVSTEYQMCIRKINNLIKSILFVFITEIPGARPSKLDLDFKLFQRCMEYLKILHPISIKVILDNWKIKQNRKLELIDKCRKEYDANPKICDDKDDETEETLEDVIFDLIHQGWTDAKILDVEVIKREKNNKNKEEMTDEEKRQAIDGLIESFIQKEVAKKLITL